MLENVLEDCELKWLQNNYDAVDTIDKRYYIPNIKDYKLEDWKNNIKSISFSNNSKLSINAIKTIIIDLNNLEIVNLDNYKCSYDISYEEYELLKENLIYVYFNRHMKYSDSRINKIINKEQYDKLILKKESLLKELEYVEASISDLGINSEK